MNSTSCGVLVAGGSLDLGMTPLMYDMAFSKSVSVSLLLLVFLVR